jgi:hypothetical protein
MYSPHRHHPHANRAALRDLQDAIREHQRAKRAAGAFADPGGRSVTARLELATCDCSREVRVAAGMLAGGGIVCGFCSTPFRCVAR